MLRQVMTSLPIRASRPGLTEFTSSVRDFVAESGIRDGLVKDGRLLLGTWQGIFLFEHRRHPSEREIVLHLVGE